MHEVLRTILSDVVSKICYSLMTQATPEVCDQIE